MKKLLLSALLFNVILFAANGLKAQIQPQSYQFAAGLKFGGYENGISGKYNAGNDVSLEAIIGFRSSGVVITGLYEINQTAFNVPELKFYYGAGAHIGSIGNSYQRFGSNGQVYANNQLLLGVDGVIGLEYLIPKSPIAVSLDLNPRVELAGGPFVDLAPGLGVKYTF
jgi:hypothetical protein